MMVGTCYARPIEDGEVALRPLRASRTASSTWSGPRRVAEGGMAFGNRQALHAITLGAVWRPAEDFGDRDTAWSRAFFAALGRFREGVYVNFLGGDEDPDRVRAANGDSVYDRRVDEKTTDLDESGARTTTSILGRHAP